MNANTIEMLVFHSKELLLFNVFEYHSKEDFIYYILFVFDQLKLDTETTPIELSGNLQIDGELFKTLYTYVRHVDINKSKYSLNFTEDLNENYLHNYFLVLNSF